jgi:ABC-type sugar transport system permease subunit
VTEQTPAWRQESATPIVGRLERWDWWSKRLTPYLYVAPALAFLAAFMAYPLAQTIIKSFYAYDLTNPKITFVGWDNYARFGSDPTFRIAVINAALYVFFSVVVQMPIGNGARRSA